MRNWKWEIGAQSRRENLKLYNTDEERGETWDQTESKVRKYLSEELGIEGCHIERAYRLPSKTVSKPVTAKFLFFKDKDKVLKSYREKKKSDKTWKEQGETILVSEYSDVRVAEDYPERVTKMRTALYPFMIQSLEAEKNAYLKYDKLVVDNVTYEYNEELKRPMVVDKPK